ncbi:MAG: engB [Gammaproteobacteria bacterium]|jgi:GTP-binding protein|nr:engB [Gammaproteobacteria bacterium]MCE3237556.1 engB [Gammaproteobacteria bacterium]
MTKPNYQNAQFILSAANLNQLPLDQGIEIAFVGRSNSGKSSVLNKLAHNKSLARVSKTPGRTQLINLFSLENNQRLVDLPGYGYAKVPIDVKLRWQTCLENYLRHRQCLKGLIMIMDIRHPLKEFDQQMLAWCAETRLPVHILLNKADKLAQGAIKKTLQQVSHVISKYPSAITVQIFSALRGTGLDELRNTLDQWFAEL